MKGVRTASTKGDLSLLDDLTVTEAHSYEGKYFAQQLLSRQVFMFRDSIKEVFDLHMPDLVYKNFCLIDSEDKKTHMYYHAPALKVVSVMSEKSYRDFYNNLTLYLDKDKIYELDGLDAFRLSEPENIIVVSLPVAESLMRRKIPGILLTHIEMV